MAAGFFSHEMHDFRGAAALIACALLASATAAPAAPAVAFQNDAPAVAFHAAAPAVASNDAAPVVARNDDAPARVVSLVPAITETLFALGLGSRVVGVSTYCDFPPDAARLPKVGTFSEPVAEAIVALHPDLVLTSPSPGNETAVRAIERTGVKVAVVQSEGAISDARSAMLQVAAAVGEADAGRRLVDAIDARLAATGARAANLDRPSVAVVIGREPLVLAGPASYLGELVTLAGGTNVAERVGGRWPRVGLEFLVASAPQVIVDLSVAMDEPARGGSADAGWSGLASVPAVAGRRIVTDRESLLLRPGPRLADAAEALLAAIHPETAAAPAGPAAR